MGAGFLLVLSKGVSKTSALMAQQKYGRIRNASITFTHAQPEIKIIV